MHKLRTSALIALAAGLLLVVGLAACGEDDGGSGSGGGDEAGESRTIAVNMYSREIPYFQEILKGMQEKADEFGWQIDPTFANNDPTQQINQIENAVTTQPDALVVVPIDEHAIVPAIQQAQSANIPAMTMGDNIAEEGRDAQLTFLGVNYEELGKEKAEFIVKELGGEGRVGWIHGIRGLNFSEQQVVGAEPVFDEASGIEVINGPYTGAFSSDAGLDATENLLSSAPDLDAIYFDNDDIALGGIQAIEDRGIDQDDILVVGTDGGPAALDAVQDGTLDATFSLCGFAQGKDAMDVLREFLDDGVEPEPLIYTDTLLFTPDNVKENLKHVKAGDC